MAGEASFRNHMDMISLNEPVTKKAKFWQSYVRALKGTDDMRADDSSYKRPASRAISEFPDFFGSSSHPEPSQRIFAPGYRYLPVSRETYGYSPRAIYGLDKTPRYAPRAASVPPALDKFPFNSKLDLPEWLDGSPELFAPTRYPLSYYKKPWSTSETPNLEKHGILSGSPYRDMMNPSPHLPISAVTRDPWWYNLGLKPVETLPIDMLRYPSALRNSYLSPVRNNYLWSKHPLRYI